MSAIDLPAYATFARLRAPHAWLNGTTPVRSTPLYPESVRVRLAPTCHFTLERAVESGPSSLTRSSIKPIRKQLIDRKDLHDPVVAAECVVGERSTCEHMIADHRDAATHVVDTVGQVAHLQRLVNP